jgi:hypothetical protein
MATGMIRRAAYRRFGFVGTVFPLSCPELSRKLRLFNLYGYEMAKVID